MDDRMIVFTHDGLTFMYRVGGIAIHDGRVLVEQAVGQGFRFLTDPRPRRQVRRRRVQHRAGVDPDR